MPKPPGESQVKTQNNLEQRMRCERLGASSPGQWKKAACSAGRLLFSLGHRAGRAIAANPMSCVQ
jgi:hypothetical protein